MIKLALPDTALYDILKLPGVISRRGVVRYIEMRRQYIANIPQKQRRPLLNLLRCVQVQFALPPFHHCADLCGSDDFFYLIPPQIHGLDGSAYTDLVDFPFHSRMPVNCFQQTPCGRGRHDIVGHAFRLHLRPGKKGVISPDLQADGHIHHSFLFYVPFAGCADSSGFLPSTNRPGFPRADCFARLTLGWLSRNDVSWSLQSLPSCDGFHIITYSYYCQFHNRLF